MVLVGPVPVARVAPVVPAPDSAHRVRALAAPARVVPVADLPVVPVARVAGSPVPVARVVLVVRPVAPLLVVAARPEVRVDARTRSVELPSGAVLVDVAVARNSHRR